MSKIKEIWCMPHSHLDVGYTHPQPLLLELQTEYIDQAIAICNKTKDYEEKARFCWTIEANYVLRKWLKTASPEKINNLKELIKEKRICVTALPMHTTPNCNLNEMVHMLTDLNELRELLETDISVAINHDVNGEPWTFGQVMLDSNIDFYLTGINIHFGGIPFKRPAQFLWEMSDGRKLHSFVGEHYSLFSQFLFTEEHNTKRMHEGILEYTARLEENGYTKDFAFLTATNPPLYDNNCPDLELADLVQKYNSEGHEYKIRFVTAEMLRDRLLKEDMDKVPVHKGDWTDYWNFGCGSTARETRVSRLAKQAVQKAEVVECFNMNANGQYKSAKEECYENMIVFDEHTWGASQSVTDPDCAETYSQLVHKIKTAYNAADLSGYLLSNQMEKLCNNPHQSNNLSGIAAVNTSQAEQMIEVTVPKSYLEDRRQLSALRTKNYVPYLDQAEETVSFGLLKLKPFTYQTLTFDKLEELKKESEKEAAAYTFEKNVLVTPFYRVTFSEESGRITQVTYMKNEKQLLNADSEYTLFEPVRETIDAAQNEQVRATLFPRDVDLGNRSITQWNHDWKGCREKAAKVLGHQVIKDAYKVTFVTQMELAGTQKLEQKITFYTYSPRIHMTVDFMKEPVYMPESIYFAVPLAMQENWKCSYDTAGEFVKLDEEQMGTVCRDWVTVDTNVSVYEEDFCVTLACKDAPMVQVGDFNFGRENKQIERKANPLLLAWTLNNYWDTNFMANQSGHMQFEYDLFAYDRFEQKQVHIDALSVQNPCVIGAMADGKNVEETLMICEGNSCVSHVYPSKKGDAINVLLKNNTMQEDVFALELKAHSMKQAAVVNVQEEVKEAVEINHNKAVVTIPPHGFKMVQIQLEK